MGYKVNTVDGHAGDVVLTTQRTQMLHRFGITADGTYQLAKPPKAGHIRGVRVYRTGGTGATVQVTNGGSNVLASALTSSTGAWAGTTTVQNAAVTALNALAIVIASTAGSPTDILVQVDFEVDAPA
ncbi:MAG: hypothetical protein EPO06_11570 [Burkholderiaceae bacterium]|nr:MAG: hypothetical protein EPO06_11570 [Burkholderiaceae bacterium]